MTDETPTSQVSSPENQAKKKKDAENNKMEQEKEQRIEDYDWQQNDIEVKVTLYVGSVVDPNEVFVKCNNRDCTVKLPDGRFWACSLYGDIVGEETTLESKDNSLVVRMTKHVTGERWQRLNSPVEVEAMDCACAVPSASVVVRQLEHVKNSWYEKSGDFVVVTMYIKNVKKESLKVVFEERSVGVQFQTSDSRFLGLHSDSTEDTNFYWTINLKDTIIPKSCTYVLKPVVLTVSLKKLDSKRWGVLEAPQIGTQGITVPNNTWVPAMMGTKPLCTVDAVTATLPAVMMEEDESNAGKMDNDGSDVDNGYQPAYSGDVGKQESSLLKKPTCMVSPLNKLHGSDQTLPMGLTGLENLGNTCFMNSVLQCLVNTQEFRQYFLGNYFMPEINTENPLGTGGKLASAFATLMGVLWSGDHKSYSPSKLKNLISMKASQFTGFAQHDAQEFMAFLLDGLHEDLNRIKEKPYIENNTVDCDNRPDEVAADEAWRLYKRRNDSVVVDLFQGQYKSKLVCPVCAKVSITFDPFLYLSVPLPKKRRMLPVTFFSKDPSRRPIKYYLHLSHNALSDELFSEVSRLSGISESNLRVVEVGKSKVQKFIARGASLENLTANVMIFVFEVLEESLAGEAVVELLVTQRIMMPRLVTRCSYCRREAPLDTKLKRCTKCYRVGYCDQSCQRHHWSSHRANCKHVPEPLGFPFIVSLPRSQATYTKLCYMMEAYAKYSVYVFQPPVKLHESLSTSSSASASSNSSSTTTTDSGRASTASSECNVGESNLGTGDGPAASSASTASTPGDDGYETESEPTVQQQLLTSMDGSSVLPSATRVVFGQPHDKAVDRPAQPFTVRYMTQSGQSIAIGGSPRVEDKGNVPLDFEASNTRCLAMDWQNNERVNNYVLVESKDLEFDSDDTYSTYLRDNQSNLTLEQCLQLFTEPEKLASDEAWYCPRCKEHREATKQMSLWRLPTILIIQLKRFSFKNLILRDKIDKTVEFPVRDLDLSRYYCGSGSDADDSATCPPVYDLYAVINHLGSILGGHYTSFARLVNEQNSRRSEVDWRLFDDSRVNFVQENTVMTRAGYVLFYRRRGSVLHLPPQMPSAASEADETNSKEAAGHRKPGGNFTAASKSSSNGRSDADDSEMYEGGDFYRNLEAGVGYGVPYTDMEAVD